MKKVLIAIDYNPVSESVAEQGYELAKTMGAEVCLIHIMADVSYYDAQYPTFLGYEGYTGMSTDVTLGMEMKKIAADFLKTAAEHLHDENVQTHLSEGDTPIALLEYAKQWNADMLVMGTHSHSALEKLLLGTVTSKVIEKTHIPVFMVPVKT